MPSVSIYSDVFVVVVINICLPPPGCIDIIGCGVPPTTVNPPDIIIDISVTVTVDVVVSLPPWNCGTPGCNSQVIIDCTVNCDIGTGGTVVIVNNEINIHIDTCVDFCGDSPDGNVIVIIIQGCIDIICNEVPIDVIVHNPCIDITLFMIQPVIVPDLTCTLYDPCTWEHSPFDIIATTVVIEVCGTITYEVDVGIYSAYITYDVDLHIVIFYCEDMSLVNTSITYTINVYLAAWPSCGGCGGSSSGTIIIVSPCIEPVITIGIVVNIDFSFNGPATWTFPASIIVPTSCYWEAVFTCDYVSGPYTGFLNLCGVIMSGGGIHTSITFSETTGIYIFDSDDMDTFATGVYHFTVTMTIGSTVTSVDFTLTIIGHCDVPTLTV
jgi:hypothetical protein